MTKVGFAELRDAIKGANPGDRMVLHDFGRVGDAVTFALTHSRARKTGPTLRPGRVCEFCRHEFVGADRAKFCKDACRVAAWRKGRRE